MDWISLFGTSMKKNYINWAVSFLWKARMMWHSRSSFFLFFIFLLVFTMYLVFYGASQWLLLKTLANDIAHLENKNAIVIKKNNNEKNQYEILLEKLPLYRSAANELDKLRTLAENRSVLIASAQYDLEKHSDELLVLRINQQLVSNYLKIRGYYPMCNRLIQMLPSRKFPFNDRKFRMNKSKSVLFSYFILRTDEYIEKIQTTALFTFNACCVNRFGCILGKTRH